MADSGQKLPQREAGIFKKIVVSLTIYEQRFSITLPSLIIYETGASETVWCASNRINEDISFTALL